LDKKQQMVMIKEADLRAKEEDIDKEYKLFQ
jgi:hypothetical protein